MKLGRKVFWKLKPQLIAWLIGSAAILVLTQNMVMPNGTATACSVAAGLNVASGVPQYCDGSKYISMKNVAVGSCGVRGQISAGTADVYFCDGSTQWSIKGPAIGSCSGSGTIGWNGTVPTICLSGTLYSSSTPSFVITQVYQNIFGRAPTSNELSSLLATLNPSVVGSLEISSVVQQGLAQNPSLAQATNATWSQSNGTWTAQALSCASGMTLQQNGTCVTTPTALATLMCPLNYTYQNGHCIPPATGGSFQTRVGIGYTLLHCAFSPDVGYPTYDNTNILAGLQGQSPVGTSNWWGRPALGYYCLTNRPDILRQHAIQLRDAGIEYVVLDVTNWGTTDDGSAAVMIEQPMQKLLEVWSQIPGAPRVVPWVLVQQNVNNPIINWLVNTMNNYPSLQFIEEGKPFYLVAGNPAFPVNQPVLDALSSQISYRTMWVPNGNPQVWASDDLCHANGDGTCNQFIATGPSGGPEMIGVASAVNRYIMSDPKQSSPKGGGQYFISQFSTLYKHNTTKFAIVNQWNEWVAYHMCYINSTGSVGTNASQCIDNRAAFVDEYNEEYSRDMEPNSYASGDLYYREIKACTANYQRGESCALTSASALPSISNNMGSSLSDESYRACTYPNDSNQPALKAGQIYGAIDGLQVSGNRTLLAGWACIVGTNAPTALQIYLGGPAGSATASYQGSYQTTVASEAAVNSICQNGGVPNRFAIDVTGLMNTHPGARLYVHGINPVNGLNYTIGGSGHCAVPWPETISGYSGN